MGLPQRVPGLPEQQEGLGLEALMFFGVGLVDGGDWADQSELGS